MTRNRKKKISVHCKEQKSMDGLQTGPTRHRSGQAGSGGNSDPSVEVQSMQQQNPKEPNVGNI